MNILVAASLVAAPAQAEFGELLYRLSDPDNTANGSFGYPVAMNGTTAIVGKVYGSPIIHVFDIATGQQRYTLANADVTSASGFVHSIAMDGNVFIVGAGDPAMVGEAYLFDLTTGEKLRQLLPTEDVYGDHFGLSVAIGGNLAIVGAPNQDALTKFGAAYVYDVSTGQQVYKLRPNDRAQGAYFGSSVDISGNVALVGASAPFGDYPRRPAAYLFDLTTGQQIRKLGASDASLTNYFGRSVAIEGNIAIVGASGSYWGTEPGRAYLFDINTGQELFKLTPSDSAPGDQFGYRVAISGHTAIVGGEYGNYQPEGNTGGSGAAYLFDVTTGKELLKLTSPDAAPGDRFGSDVAIYGDIAIVGSPRFWTDDGDGSVYVFDVRRDSTIPGDFNNDGTVDAADYVVWRNGLGTTYTPADYDAWRANFGRSAGGAAAVAEHAASNANVAQIPEPTAAVLIVIGLALTPCAVGRRPRRFIDGKLIAQADGGIAMLQILLRRMGRSIGRSSAMDILAVVSVATAPAQAEFGDLLYRLSDADSTVDDYFGWSVAINGTTAIVGNGDGIATQTTHVFDIATGQERYRVIHDDVTSPVGWGHSVATDGSVFIAGAGDPGKTGEAYLFDLTTGETLRQLLPTENITGDHFGLSVAIGGNRAIVGAQNQDPGASFGAAYVFDVSTGQQVYKLRPNDPKQYAYFGHSIDISGNFALVSAPSLASERAGAAYLFDLTTGQQIRKFTASDAHPFDYFGGSVDIEGNIAIVGASGTYLDSTGNTPGRAYLFDINTGQELFKLTPSDSVPGDGFGSSVAISGNTAIVGAVHGNYRPVENTSGYTPGSGAAYLFDVTTGKELLKLTAPDAAPGDRFGSVDIYGDTAIVGSIRFGSSGAAYVFDVRRDSSILGDFKFDGTVDAADYVVWRNGLGTSYTQTDYDAWRANFGRSAAAGAVAVAGSFSNGPGNIPEPASTAMVFVSVVLLAWSRRCRIAPATTLACPGGSHV
jgi:WD40 repeat protein